MPEQDFSGGRRPADPNTPPRQPAMTDTLAKIRQAEQEAGGALRGSMRAISEAAEIPGVKSRNAEQPAPDAASGWTTPKAKKLEDPIETRIETHRASISSHERSIVALASRRDIDTRRLQGELAELTRSFEETRDLYFRSISGIGREIDDQIDKHRRLVDSDRAAMDSLLGRHRLMAVAEGTDEHIARKVEEGIKSVLEARDAQAREMLGRAMVRATEPPVAKPQAKRKQTPRAAGRRAVAAAIKATAPKPAKDDLVSRALKSKK